MFASDDVGPVQPRTRVVEGIVVVVAAEMMQPTNQRKMKEYKKSLKLVCSVQHIYSFNGRLGVVGRCLRGSSAGNFLNKFFNDTTIGRTNKLGIE